MILGRVGEVRKETYSWFGEEGEDPRGLDDADGGAGFSHGLFFLSCWCVVF